MAKKPSGRRRADVQVSILDQFELRSRRHVEEKQNARERRAARKAAKQVALVELMLAEETAPSIDTPAVPTQVVRHAKAPSVIKRKITSYATMAIAAGFVTSFGLPSYAFSPDIAAQSAITTATAGDLIEGVDTHTFTVGQLVAAKFVQAQAKYKTGSASDIYYTQTMKQYLAWSGPSAADWVSNPKYPNMTPELIMKVAAQYVGTPYVFNGDNPRGFDCSGYVMYVFSQFGIPLPHSVRMQDYMVQLGYAVNVKVEDARPGDIVIFNDRSHDGIYAGNGNFYHAPRRGDSVKLAPIFVENYHIIRLLPR